MAARSGPSGPWFETPDLSVRLLTMRLGASRPATPQSAIAACHVGQAVLVVRPARVLGQLEVLLGRLPALTVLRLLFHFRRGLLHQRQDVLSVLLGSEPVARLAGIMRSQSSAMTFLMNASVSSG